ncbi:MAG: hypothetical protein HY223_04260 [Thaumarchaeota archaeon]|nr:hypothetical protein [Nitrososphaerota archaeon]
MITSLEKLKTKKYLLISLSSTAFVIAFANLFGENPATLASDWINLPVTGAVVILSILAIRKHGITGSHGKAWVFFTICIALWFVAERIWMIYELGYHTNPWPSEADFFWLAGYPLYYMFSILYLKPFKNSITKRILISAIFIPVVVLIPTLYLTLEKDSELSNYEKVLDASYPVADAISLVPAVIGISLFFKGNVNFSWALLLFGTLSFTVSDFGYLYLTLGNMYYTGHPIDIPYIWAYILFSFAVYGDLKIFRKPDRENVYHDQEKFK